MAKKCPICKKNYRDWISHIWSHKKKTVAYLAKKRKSASKSTKKARVSKRKKGKYCSECGRRM